MELIVLDHCKFCQLIDLGTEDIQGSSSDESATTRLKRTAL